MILALLLPLLLPLLPVGQDAGPNSDERTLVIYDVADVVQAAVDPASRPELAVTTSRSFLGPDGRKRTLYEVRGLDPAEAGDDAAAEPAPVDAEELGKRVAEAERLARVVREWVRPPLFPGDEVRAVGAGQLVVLTGARQHAWIRTFLEKQRKSRVLYDIGARYVEAPSGGFFELGYVEPSQVFGDAEALQAARARIDAAEGFSTKEGPRLVSPNNDWTGQATMAGLNYVKEWKLVTVHPGRRRIADPVIDQVWVGDGLEGVAFELPNGNFGVELRYARESVVEPIPTLMVPLGDSGEEAEVARPEAAKFEMEAAFELRPGGGALFWSPKPDGTGETGVLITFGTR